MIKTYIDKEINEYYNESAEYKLLENNDTDSYIKGDGILEVSIDRWKDAQFFERKFWIGEGDGKGGQSNYGHMRVFNNYQILADLENVDVIELGCGPFTNLDLMKFKSIRSIDLLDPLLKDYFSLNACPYKHGKLKGVDANLLASSIEDYDFTKTYDVVIMINVLEHCFNMNTVFSKIKKMLRKDGLFIFSEACIKDNMIDDFVNNVYDSGHPLRVSNKKLDEYLSDYNKVYNREFQGLWGQPWRIDKYCILKHKS